MAVAAVVVAVTKANGTRTTLVATVVDEAKVHQLLPHSKQPSRQQCGWGLLVGLTFDFDVSGWRIRQFLLTFPTVSSRLLRGIGTSPLRRIGEMCVTFLLTTDFFIGIGGRNHTRARCLVGSWRYSVFVYPVPILDSP